MPYLLFLNKSLIFLILDLHSNLLNPLWSIMSMLFLESSILLIDLAIFSSLLSHLCYNCFNSPLQYEFLQHFINLNNSTTSKTTTLPHGASSSLYRYLWLRVRYESTAEIHPSYCCLSVLPLNFFLFFWLVAC